MAVVEAAAAVRLRQYLSPTPIPDHVHQEEAGAGAEEEVAEEEVVVVEEEAEAGAEEQSLHCRLPLGGSAGSAKEQHWDLMVGGPSCSTVSVVGRPANQA